MKSITKKILLTIAIILSVSLITSFTTPSSVSADCRYMLGFTSWDCGVGEITNEEQLKSSIWTIVANVATDVTVAASYLVLGFVIYGGYLYIFSGGEPGKTASGKKTLTHAFIGLAIVLLTNVIMSTIRYVLIRGGDFSNCASSNCVDPSTLISQTIQWVIGVAGVISAIFIIYGGISYMMSAGDPSKLQKAKQIITYALIGLAVVALSELITLFVSNTIHNAASTTIKEVYEIKKIS